MVSADIRSRMSASSHAKRIMNATELCGSRRGTGLENTLVAVQDVSPGFWLWRARHAHWHPQADWGPVVTTCVVDIGDDVILIDPMAPPDGARDVWERLDRRPPTAVVVLKPDHVRDVGYFARRYGARAFGPRWFFPDNRPDLPLEPVYPGMDRPGNLLALDDGRAGGETPVWVPGARALVVADALTDQGGTLALWSTPWDEETPRRVLARWLQLPFDVVVISHGTRAVYDRRAYERALDQPPWQSDELKAWLPNLARYRELLSPT